MFPRTLFHSLHQQIVHSSVALGFIQFLPNSYFMCAMGEVETSYTHSSVDHLDEGIHVPTGRTESTHNLCIAVRGRIIGNNTFKTSNYPGVLYTT